MPQPFFTTRKSKRAPIDDGTESDTDDHHAHHPQPPKRRRGRGSIAITQPRTALRGDLLHAYTKAQLEKLGFWEYADASLLPPLGNAPVGPFQTAHWHMNPPQLQTLAPVLRLASRLILSPASLRFCHALIANPRRRDVRASRIWYPQRADAKLEELGYGPRQQDGGPRAAAAAATTMGAMVRRALERLAADLHWYAMTPRHPSWPTFEYSDAVTTRADVDAAGSDIYLNYRSIETLRILALPGAARTGTRAKNAILRLRLHLAITVCHETIHALNHFVAPNPPYFVEPFFGNNRITEMGFAWEQEVFGGEINWWWDETDFAQKAFLPFTVMKWPSAWIWGDEFEAPQVELARRWPKGSSTMFFVSMAWVDRVEKDGFWEGLEEREGGGLEALFPPKTHGIRIWSGAPHHVDEAWRKSLSEERWTHDWKGRVVRWPGLRDGLTPSPKRKAWAGGGEGDGAGEDDIVTNEGELPRWVVRRLSRPESDSDTDSEEEEGMGTPDRRSTRAAGGATAAAHRDEDEWRFAIPGGGVEGGLLERFGGASAGAVYEAVDRDGAPLQSPLDEYGSVVALRKRKKSVEEVGRERWGRKRSRFRR